MDLSQFETPKGVELREFSKSVTVRIFFIYRSERCRENFESHPLPEHSGSSITDFKAAIKRSMKSASQLLVRVNNDISTHSFDYAAYFPDSKNCKKFGHGNRDLRTVRDYLSGFLARCKKRMRPDTLDNYRKIIDNQLIPEFGSLLVTDLTPGLVRDWVFEKSHTCKRKTISNVLSPFKMAMDDAVMDRVINDNPVRAINIDTIVTVESRQSEFKPDPFSEEEITLLLGHMDGQIRNLFQFAFYTGLRTSELIALTWEKVDFVNREVLVDQAMVKGHLDRLKTADKGVSSRTVLLLDQALDALQKQKAKTFLEGNYIFQHPFRPLPWQDDAQIRRYAWKPALKRAGLRYRNPYQTRHTYAHMLIRDNENPWWIANQLGHSGIEMLNRHYGGWLEQVAEKYIPKHRFSENNLQFKSG